MLSFKCSILRYSIPSSLFSLFVAFAQPVVVSVSSAQETGQAAIRGKTKVPAQAILAPAKESPQSAPAESSELKPIFDGKSLDGWEGDSRLWSVRDGVIHGETTTSTEAKGNTFLIWRGGTTENFELRLSFRCNATNNSGIQYRSKHIDASDAPNAWVLRGYQHEIRNEVDFPNVSGFIYGEGLANRGRICLVGEQAHMADGAKQVTATLIDNDEFRKLFRLDDWNDVVIIAQDRRLRHYMNGRLILDFTDAEDLALTSGVLGLQLHAGKPMWVEYKDIRIHSTSGQLPH